MERGISVGSAWSQRGHSHRDRSPVVQQRALGGASSSGGEFTDMIEEDGALQRIELGGIEGDLGEEGIVHQDGGLVAVACVGIAQQGGDIDLEGAGEPVEGGERRHGLAIFDFGDVGAGNAHAGGKLALGEVADMAQIADCSSDLETFFLLGGWGNQS